MRITNLAMKNYRTFESEEIRFPTFFTAICGQNDAGKTNIIKVLRCLLAEEERYYILEDAKISFKDDFTKWSSGSGERKIIITLELLVQKDNDAGLYDFIVTYLKLDSKEQDLSVIIKAEYSQGSDQKVYISIGGKDFSGVEAQQVLKQIKSSSVIFFHNSTESNSYYLTRRSFRTFAKELSSENLEKIKKKMNKELTKIARNYQKEFSNLLGQLESRYEVGFSLPTYDTRYFPFNITLGDKKINIELDEWGSGTRNRTLILFILYRAKQISESETSASKNTPIIVVEEPESFLHPSAQAEFGRILQDLSKEFKVQVIVTTHSPYMLSQENPGSNVLLQRRVKRSKLRETLRVDTSGKDWMVPFAQALGINKIQFEPWRDIIFGNASSILLVEGPTDKKYFELLKKEDHANKKLLIKGEIYSYEGRDNLKNVALLKFIKDRYKKIFITFDLDAESVIEPTLIQLGFEKGKHYMSVGLNKPGLDKIEGLIPEKIRSKVYSNNANLVEQARSGDKDTRKSANSNLKDLIFKEFLSQACPGDEYYGNFYPVIQKINKVLG